MLRFSCKVRDKSRNLSGFLPIVKTLGYAESNGKLYLTMPHLQSLHSVLHSDSEESLSLDLKMQIMFKMAKSLRMLHHSGNMHGHLNSFNVFVISFLYLAWQRSSSNRRYKYEKSEEKCYFIWWISHEKCLECSINIFIKLVWCY